MLYQSYKNKLQKRRRIFDCVWRFRALILLGFALVLAAAGAMLGVKGIVYGEDIAGSFIYGETPKPEAEAVFGDAKFEYRAADGEWSEVVPKKAGQYECRAVCKTVVGTTRYGKAMPFEILPADGGVWVEDGSITYGETPRFSADLRYDDEIIVENYNLERSGSRVSVTALSEGVKILNAEGEDVTDCYNLSYITKTLTEGRRKIEINTASQSFIYDGAAHSAEEFTVSGAGLAEGDRAELTYASATNAGSYKNTAQYKILNAEGENVTDRYSVTLVAGDITVEKRPLEIGGEEEFVYDGQPHVLQNLVILSGELAEDDEIEIAYAPRMTNAGDYTESYNENFEVNILSNGKTATQNYLLTFNFSSVSVKKRDITLYTRDETLTYNGGLQGDRKIEVAEESEPLVSGHTISANVAQYTNAGSYQKTAQNIKISASYGSVNVTDNYNINYIAGELEITPRHVTLQTASAEFVYDGEEHGADIITVAEGSEPLVSGHAARGVFTHQKNCGNYPNAAQNVEIYFGAQNLSDNYIIDELLHGEITITERVFVIQTLSAEFEYDGEEHELPQAEASGLVEGHTFEITDITEHVFVKTVSQGSVSNDFKFEHKIYDGDGEDVTQNYNLINIEKGEISVNERAVTLLSGSGTFTYDGKPHGVESYEAVTNSLVAGDELTPEYPSFTAARALPYANQITGGTEVKNAAGEDVSSNYAITWQYGTIVINQKPITIATQNVNGVYNGKNQITGDVCKLDITYFEENDLSHEITPSFTARVNAGEYENECAVTIKSGAEDVTSNYDITYTFGRVAISKRPVTYLTGSLSGVVYDGEEHKEEGHELKSGNLLSGHEIAFTFPSFVNKGEYQNVPTEYKITSANGDETQNYEVTITAGTIEIIPRKVTLQTLGGTFIYNGKPQGSDDITAAADSENLLVEGHVATGTFAHPTNKGTYYNEVTNVKIYNGAEDVSENYEIVETLHGEIIINAREFTVKTDDYTAVYNGAEQECPKAQAQNVVDGHRFEITVTNPVKVKNATEEPVPNNFEFTWKIYDGQDDVTDNYDLATTEYGNIQITKRQFTADTGGDSWEYDGEEHYCTDKVIFNNLVEGHTYEYTVTEYPTVKEVLKEGESVVFNELEFTWKIFDEEEKEVSDNYNLSSTTNQTITITPREITLKVKDFIGVYNGNDQIIEDFEPVGDKTLLDGHTLRDIRYQSYKNVKFKGGEVKPYENLPLSNQDKVYDKNDGDRDVSHNYKINWKEADFTITPRPITLSTKDFEWTYNAACDYAANGVINDDIPEEDRLISVQKKEDDAGKVSGHIITFALPQFTEANEDGYTLADGYEILNVIITDADGTDITYNYKLEIKNEAKVIIFKREINIKTSSQTFVYDAEEVKSKGGYENAGVYYTDKWVDRETKGLVKGQHFAQTTDGTKLTEITDTDDEVVEVDNVRNGIRIVDLNLKDEQGNPIDRTNNYKMNIVWGKLRVKSPVIIRLYDVYKEYDGTPLEYEEDEFEIIKLPPDLTEANVEVKLRGSRTAVGSSSLSKIYSDSYKGFTGNDLLGNALNADGSADYGRVVNRIDFTGNPLEIRRRKIVISTASISVKNEGETLYGNMTGLKNPYWISFGSLVDGHYFDGGIAGKITGVLAPEADSAENTLAVSSIIIYDSNGNVATNCYDITVICGTLSWAKDDEQGENGG